MKNKNPNLKINEEFGGGSGFGFFSTDVVPKFRSRKCREGRERERERERKRERACVCLREREREREMAENARERKCREGWFVSFSILLCG